MAQWEDGLKWCPGGLSPCGVHRGINPVALKAGREPLFPPLLFHQRSFLTRDLFLVLGPSEKWEKWSIQPEGTWCTPSDIN